MCVKWMKILGLVCSVVSQIYVEICCHLGRYSCEQKVCGGVCHNGAVGTGASITWEVAMGRSVEWSGSTSMRVMVATTPIAVVTRSGSRATESRSVPVFMAWASGVAVMSRGRPSTSVIGVSPVVGWCTWWWYLIWAIHGYMSIIITVIALYVWAIACHMANFLALKTPIIITWHGVDWWGG